MADMDFEISKFGPNSRTSVTNKLKKYRLDVEIIQKDLVRLFANCDFEKKNGGDAMQTILLKKKATNASVNTSYQNAGSSSQVIEHSCFGKGVEAEFDSNFVASFKDNFDPDRKKVLQIHQSLTNAGNSLARSTQVAIETEQIGHEVLGELNDQGERLRRTYDTVRWVFFLVTDRSKPAYDLNSCDSFKLEDTNVALSRSRRLLNKLSRG